MGLRELCGLTVVDGEVQGFYSLAALWGSGLKGVVATFSVLCAMPSVRVAGGLREVFCLTLEDGQVQRDDGIAALHRRELLRVVSRRSVWDPVPGVAFAGLI